MCNFLFYCNGNLHCVAQSICMEELLWEFFLIHITVPTKLFQMTIASGYFFSFSDYFRPHHCVIMQWKLCTMLKLVKTCLEEGSISCRPRLRRGIQISRCISSHIWWLISSQPQQVLTEKGQGNEHCPQQSLSY